MSVGDRPCVSAPPISAATPLPPGPLANTLLKLLVSSAWQTLTE